MPSRYLIPVLILTIALPLCAQDVARPDHAERSRPSLDRKHQRGSKVERPYLMTSRPVDNPYFLNVSAIVEPASSQPQNESSIAVNPLRPNVLISSAVDYRNGAWAYISTNAGRSWRNVSLGDVRAGWPSGNDPSVAFDHLGNGYVMYGAIVRGNSDPTKNGQSGIYISRTTDDGATWTKHIPVIEHQGAMTADSALEDKYYVEIDRSATSPYLGWMYTPWKRVIDSDSSTQIMFARSTDGGSTWSSPIEISPRKPGTSLDTTFGQSFPIAAAGPDGSVCVVWHDGPERKIGFARSTDGGATFTAPRYPVTGNADHGTAKKIRNEVFHVLKNTFRAETYPTIMVDNSSSPRRGWIYLAWAAGVNPNVYFIRSSDAGQTWSTPMIIHSDTTNDQWWPWLSVDQTNGEIAVMYSDSRHDTENILVDQYVSYSTDGGTTWVDRRATDAMSDFRQNPFEQGIFAGDYSGNAFYAGRIYPSFLDTRTDDGRKDNDLYVSLINTQQPLPVDSLRSVIDPVALTELELFWSLPAEMTTVFGRAIDEYSIVVERDSVPLAVLAAGTTSLEQSGLEHGRLYTFDVSVATATDTSAVRTLVVRAGGALEPMAPQFLSARAIGIDSVDLTFETPSMRADGSIPLTNLDAIQIYRDGTFRREIPLFAEDTARTITIRDAVPERGYYRFHITAIDEAEPPHESASSDTLVVYAGDHSAYSESFDGVAPRFLMTGDWGVTSAVALTPPSSLTDSPEAPYKGRTNWSVQLYPVATTLPYSPVLSFAHIAIVDPSDSAIVEYRYGDDSAWTVLRSFNWNETERWSDSVANPGDWQSVTMAIPRSDVDSVVTVRFRLRTNIFRHADGWYLDDISWDLLGGIDETRTAAVETSARPNPFSGATIIDYTLGVASAVRLRIVDIVGREVRDVDLGQMPPGRHAYTVDGTTLAPGTYFYEIITESGRCAGNLRKSW